MNLKAVWLYDLYVIHETLRISVVLTLNDAKKLDIPHNIVEQMKKTFLECFEYYLTSCDINMKYDSTVYKVSFVCGGITI